MARMASPGKDACPAMALRWLAPDDTPATILVRAEAFTLPGISEARLYPSIISMVFLPETLTLHVDLNMRKNVRLVWGTTNRVYILADKWRETPTVFDWAKGIVAWLERRVSRLVDHSGRGIHGG